MKKFKIPHLKNNFLIGYIYEKNINNLVIICNGYGATKDFPSIVSLAEEIYKKGYSVIRFDFSGTGESTGPSSILIKQQVEDINQVINHFSDYKKIILVGGSLGAIPATITTFLNKKISLLVTVNGFFGKPTLAKKEKRTYYIHRILTIFHPKFRKDYKYFLENLVPQKISTPTLVIYSKTDEVVSPSQSQEFYSKLNPKFRSLDVLPLKKHNLNGPGDTKKVAASIAKHIINPRG